MSTSITFLRHAQTSANEKGFFNGSLDEPLSPIGEESAQKMAQELSEERFDAIFYGKKKRVLQTTDYVLSQLKHIPPILLKTDEIKEINFGLFEGLTADEIEKKYPEEWKQYMENWQKYSFPQGESLELFYENCEKFIHNLVLEYENNRILIVAHKGFILACWSALLTGDPADVFTRDIKNAEYVTLTV